MQILPTVFLARLQNDSTMRGPGRLFLYLRRFVGSKYHPSTQRHLLTDHFSNYQIAKYLSILVAKKYLRRDQDGHYYLNALQTLQPDEYRPDGSRIKRPYVTVPDAALRENGYWKNFIAGVLVGNYARSLRYGRTAKRAAYFAATNDPTGIGTVYVDGVRVTQSYLANSSLVQGVSLPILAKHTGRHKSTMSRWRKKGQAFGYKLGRWFYKVDLEITPDNLSWCRNEDQCRDLNRIVIRGGKVMEEAPSQLIFAEKMFFVK